MFNCGKCTKPVGPGIQQRKVVVKTRRVSYPERLTSNKTVDPGGEGYEIVKEIAVCEQCESSLED